MAGPWEQYQKQQPAPEQEAGPWQQFQQAPQAPAGFDPNAPIKDVEAALARMPEAERKAAVRQWGETRARKLKEAGFETPKFATNALRGTPIGPWLDEMSGGFQAAAYAMSGGRVGAPYELAKAEQEAQFRALDATDQKLFRLPEARIGTEKYGIDVGGDVTTGDLQRFTGGAMSAVVSPTIRAFQGTTMPPATANAMLTGAAYGGLIGAGEGETLQERATGAAFGAGGGLAIGGAAVPIAHGVGGLIRMGREALSPTPQPLKQYSRSVREAVIRSATDDNLPANYGGGERARRQAQVGPNDTLARERIVRDTPDLGREGMLLDMGGNMRGQASAIHNMPGEGQTIIREALQRRYDTAPTRIDEAVNRTFGPTGFNERDAQRFIKAANRRAQPYYQQADKATWRPQATPQMDALLEKAKAAGVMPEAEKILRMEGFDPAQATNTFRYLDAIKRALDDEASKVKRGTNLHRLYSDLARDIRNTADDMLVSQGVFARDATGQIIQRNGKPISPYQYAREIGADERGVRDAIEAGQKAFRKSQDGNRYTAERMQEDLAQMSPREQAAYRRAARGDARDAARQAGRTLSDGQDSEMLKYFSSPDSRDKVRHIALGTQTASPAQRTDAFLNRLDAEAKFARSRNEITGNSATAGRQAAQKEFPQATTPEDFRGIGNRSLFGTAIEYGLARPLNAILGGAISEARAQKAIGVARIMTAQGAERDQIVQAIIDVVNRRNVTQAQTNQIRELIANALQAGRTQMLTDASP